jgi:hypothetical protein
MDKKKEIKIERNYSKFALSLTGIWMKRRNGLDWRGNRRESIENE